MSSRRANSIRQDAAANVTYSSKRCRALSKCKLEEHEDSANKPSQAADFALPAEIKIIQSFSSFKYNLKNYLLQCLD